MKNIISTVIAVCCSISFSFAQNYDIVPGFTEYNDSEVTTLNITLPGDDKDVKKKWKDYLENTYSLSVEGFGLFGVDEVVYTEYESISTISEDEITLYLKAKESNDMTKAMFFTSTKTYMYDLVLDQVTRSKLEDMINGFSKYYLDIYHSQIIDEIREEASSTADEIKDMRNDISEKRKDIENKKEEITKLEKEIIDLDGEIREFEIKLSKEEDKLEEEVDRRSDVLNNKINK